jgi:hypothetical protein
MQWLIFQLERAGQGHSREIYELMPGAGLQVSRTIFLQKIPTNSLLSGHTIIILRAV